MLKIPYLGESMRKILVFPLMILLAASVFPQKKLTLDEAVKIALQRNSSVIKAKNNLASTEKSLKSAYGDLLPNLGARGSFNWQKISDVGGTQLDFLGNPIVIPASETDSRTYGVSVGGGVTLFDGLANIANISQADDNVEAAKYDIAKLKQDIVLQTTNYFYSVLKAKKLLGVRDENVKYNQKFLETVQEKNRLGSVAIADVYAQQVAFGNAELAQIQAQNDYEFALNTLLNYLSLNVLEDYEAIDPFAGVSEAIDTDEYLNQFNKVDAMVEEALDNRDDYKAQRLTLNAAESGITVSRGGLFPSLTGNYSFSTSATKAGDLFDRKVWGAGLTLSIPIFSNWNTEESIEFAKVRALNANEDLMLLERQIKVEIKQGYLNLVAAKKALDVSTKNVVSAGENRKVNNERYSLGSGTILDVLQADKNYTEALSNKISAEYDFYSVKDALLNYLGKLDTNKFE